MADLEKSLLELVEHTAWDLPGDVDRALRSALKPAEEGTNGRAALEMAFRAIERSREHKIPLASEPVSLLFTVEAPAGTDLAPFRAAAAHATHAAAEAGLIETPAVDLPSEKPRRGNSLGLVPLVRFIEGGPKTRVHLRMQSPGEAECVQISTLPSSEIGVLPSLESLKACVLAAIVDVQGRCVGPGVVGVHVSGDPVDCLLGAEAELLRPVGQKSTKRPFGQLETAILEGADQLNIGPLGLGGQPTILAAHLGGDSAPRDQWSVGIVFSSWALRRHSITLDAKGGIASWETQLPATAKKMVPAKKAPPAPKPESAPAAAKKPAAKAATKAAPEKGAKKTAKKATANKTAPKQAPTQKAPAKKTAATKAPAKKTPAKKTTKKKS